MKVETCTTFLIVKLLLIGFLLGSTQKIERLVVHDLCVVPRKDVGVGFIT